MKYLIVSYLTCGVGVAMLITGLLPEDKIDALCARLGIPTKPRWYYLVGAAVILPFGLLGVIFR